ncbi:hypothetical protein BCR43DRAFT_40341 [Syncephalastrum racemosum]|uniref:Uncharacterized protein n=1 Tax=Syncephalastrum racemosum TaxID=13706 RepID=A0A1X2HUG3_SYNRA|nr:hypothetical protein BCR43DRAFT_40341 [Syncephalastrum racemosum]
MFVWSQLSNETMAPHIAARRSSLGHQDEEDELEALQVPSWSDTPPRTSTTAADDSSNNNNTDDAASRRESLSWTDSFVDDSDYSIAMTTTTTSSRGVGPAAVMEKRRSKDLLKMLHQAQADLLVKKELVGQLEKSEDEYTQMRTTYEGRLKELEAHLDEVEKQRDRALHIVPTVHATTPRRRTTVPNTKTGKTQEDMRRGYEARIKKLTSENQEWKRKHAQASRTLETARAKAEAYVSKMRAEVDALKLEKSQLSKALRMNDDRLREQERELTLLRKREVAMTEAKAKMDQQYEQALQKRSDELASVSQQMRQLTAVLRRAAADRITLSDTALDRLMQRATDRATSSK